MLVSSHIMCLVAFRSLVSIEVSSGLCAGVHLGQGLPHLVGGEHGPICSRASEVAARAYWRERAMVGHLHFPDRT